MRIVKRQELMTLPVGTLYMNVYTSAGSSGFTTRGLAVFGGALYEVDGRAYDFTERDVASAAADDYGQQSERTTGLLAGSSYPVNPSYGRDGMFEDDDQYLVYEDADIESILTDVLKAYPGVAAAADARPFGDPQEQADRGD